jgi:hypothetical protein
VDQHIGSAAPFIVVLHDLVLYDREVLRNRRAKRRPQPGEVRLCDLGLGRGCKKHQAHDENEQEMFRHRIT